jgi:archaeosine-15-forming tRNA-guanine transglycosylase
MILRDVMVNTNVKEEIVEGKSIFVNFIIIKRNIT